MVTCPLKRSGRASRPGPPDGALAGSEPARQLDQQATRGGEINWWTTHYDDYDTYMQAGSAGELGRLRVRAAHHTGLIDRQHRLGQRVFRVGRRVQIEAEQGRKPGRKEKSEIKDEIVLTFLPRAFSKRSSHVIWLDLEKRSLVIAASSMKSRAVVIRKASTVITV